MLVTLAEVLRYESEGKYEESIKQCKIAVRLSSGFSPPLFFLGRIYHKKEEGFIAERYFGQALEILPDYMAPRLYKIRSLIKLEDYSSALIEVDLALTNLPYWYFYFTKAQILVHLKKYKEARDIILEKCIPLNKYHFDSFILLGEVCILVKDLDCAKDYYLQAGDIDPENPTFSVKMNELKNITRFIRSEIKRIFKTAKSSKVLYGGSINDKNIGMFSSISDIDGFLIGGASQSSKKFIDIVKNYYK